MKQYTQMSNIQTTSSIATIIQEFDFFLNNFEKIVKEEKPSTDISNTKLYKIKEDLLKFDDLDDKSLSKLLETACKYNSINSLFKHDKCKFNKTDLIKILKGTHDYTADSNEQYNDFFFELSMGSRFIQAFKNESVTIHLNTDCDVIINNDIAIECKYIHSSSKIITNINKAKKQIETRIKDGLAQSGFIAIDLPHVYPHQKVNKFVQYTFNKFLENCEIFKDKIPGNLVKIITDNKHFQNIIQTYISHELEVILYSEIGFDYDLGEKP